MRALHHSEGGWEERPILLHFLLRFFDDPIENDQKIFNDPIENDEVLVACRFHPKIYILTKAQNWIKLSTRETFKRIIGPHRG